MTTQRAVRRTIGFLAVLSVMSTHACQDDHPTEFRSGDDNGPGEATPLLTAQLGENPQMLDLAERIPGFGGFFFEPDGDRIVVAMTAAGAAGFPEARQAVSAAITDVGPLRTAHARSPVFVERVVEYSFIELARHRSRLRARLFAIPEVVSLSVDEASNRIAIGLTDQSAAVQVQDLAIELRVPLEMLSFGEASRVELLRKSTNEVHPVSGAHTLQDSSWLRKVRSAYKIDVSSAPRGACTLAFPALLVEDYSAMQGFVSASHCSGQAFALDSEHWYQPVAPTGIDFGWEHRDPDPFPCTYTDESGDDVDYDRCRNADASFVLTTLLAEQTNPLALGQITRTVDRMECTGTGSDLLDCDGSIEVDTLNLTIPVASRGGPPVQNEWLDKIGQMTGWNYGLVHSTCVDVKPVPGSTLEPVVILCSDFVVLGSGDGDSGAPVFRYDDIDDTAELVGMIWGGNPLTGVYVSSLGKIEEDLVPNGFLWVLEDPGAPTADIYGPTTVDPESECTWWGYVSGGIPPYRYSWSGILSGSGSTVTGRVTESGWLKLTVTDAISRDDQDSLYVEVLDLPLPLPCLQ